MFHNRVDPLLGEGRLIGERRAVVVARCAELSSSLDELDAQLADIVRKRREVAGELRKHRRRLWPKLAHRARQPGPDGSVQLPPVPNDATYLWGRRLRAVCVALLDRMGSLPLVELHGLLHRYRVAVAGTHPVKALADALGYETDKGRVRRVSRGVYEALTGAARTGPLWPGGPGIDALLAA